MPAWRLNRIGSGRAAPAATLLALLTEAAQRESAAIALLAPRRPPLSYGRLLVEVEAVAAKLRGFGIGRGDRVAVVLPSGPEMAVAFLGITVGAACVPLNPAYLRESSSSTSDGSTSRR